MANSAPPRRCSRSSTTRSASGVCRRRPATGQRRAARRIPFPYNGDSQPNGDLYHHRAAAVMSCNGSPPSSQHCSPSCRGRVVHWSRNTGRQNRPGSPLTSSASRDLPRRRGGWRVKVGKSPRSTPTAPERNCPWRSNTVCPSRRRQGRRHRRLQPGGRPLRVTDPGLRGRR